MAITFERIRIKGENVAPDNLLWRRYKRPFPGMLEMFLDINPQVHEALAAGPFLPVGVVVVIPIDSRITSDAPMSLAVERLWGNTGAVT